MGKAESCVDKSSSSNCAGLGHIPSTKASSRDAAMSGGQGETYAVAVQCVKARLASVSQEDRLLASQNDKRKDKQQERRALPRGASAGIKRSQRVELRGEKRGYIHTPRRVDEGEE